MQIPFIHSNQTTLRLGMVALGLGMPAAAVGAAEATANPAGPAKSGFNLFDPAPVDQMRGMETDRPNHTNSPHTVDAGHIQIEGGLADYAYYRDHEHDADQTIDSLAAGQLNFRLGLLNQLEINAAISSFNFLRVTDHHAHHTSEESGFGDLMVGGKINIWGNDGANETLASALAIQPQLVIPTAGRNVGNGHPEFFGGIPVAVNLPAEFHLGAETIVSWERNAARRGDVAGWQNSISLDRVLLKKFDIYIEYWSRITTERRQETRQSLDVGMTLPLNDNVIIDTGLNFGLNRSTNTIEWLAGVSVRF